jgi:hypothetical protein
MGNECITQAHDVRAALANYDKAIELYPEYIDDCKETLAAISKATRKVWDLVEVTTASFKSVRRIMGKWAGWVY